MIVLAIETMGRIDGGWNFVWAAYGITWVFFAVYTASLLFRSASAAPSKENR